MSQQGQFGGYPDDGQPGYPQQYTPPPTALPHDQYISPGRYPVHPHYPQQHPGAQAVAGTAPGGAAESETEPRPRRALKLLIPLCVVLTLAFGGSAYFFFLSGDAPAEVVGQYITHAQDEDFVGAREYTADKANKSTKFQGTSEDMKSVRRWFGEDSMRWEVREDSTSGSKSIVTVDKTLVLPSYDDPVDMRWDYWLIRESGSWKIDRIKIMSIVEDGIAAPGDCLLATGFVYEVTDCSTTGDAGSTVVTVTDAVGKPEDCPNPAGPAAETTRKTILCLEEKSSQTA